MSELEQQSLEQSDCEYNKNLLQPTRNHETTYLLDNADVKPVTEIKEEDVLQKEKPPSRRADIDVIIIFLTYGIYLFHLSVIYFPANRIPHSNKYPNLTSISRDTSEDPFTIINPSYILEWFAGFMYGWNMPMFFYLSGHNAYSALFRRSEIQFRDERVHRLLVPCLFFVIVGQLPYSVSYFSPRYPPLAISYWDYLKNFYANFDLQAAWFLWYLFFFFQFMTYWFTVFHPAHNTSDSTEIVCCGSTTCCCSVRPLNCLTRFFCCLHFLLQPSKSPEEFKLAVSKLLGGPYKLALVPAILLALFEVLHNLTPYLTIVRLKFFAVFFQFTTTFSYLLIFVLGYATAAADPLIRQTNKVWAWSCFVSGMVLCTLFGVVAVLDTNPIQYGTDMGVLGGLTRGSGQWLFIIGAVSLAREKYSEPRDWHRTLREMALPFYLVHQWVINPVTSGALWVPYLRSFPVVLVITTVPTVALAYLITKSGSLRYFFGLPPPKGSILPGKRLRGFVPVLILAGVELVCLILANTL